MAAAFVKGLQGDNPKYWLAASLMKYFLANSNENGRDGSSSNFDERLLREYYSVPLRMGVMEGGSRAYMAAYTAHNGISMTASPILKGIESRTANQGTEGFQAGHTGAREKDQSEAPAEGKRSCVLECGQRRVGPGGRPNRCDDWKLFSGY